MKQIYTILFDLDGTLVDTAPDLMRAHNHVMNKFGYPTKSTEESETLSAKVLALCLVDLYGVKLKKNLEKSMMKKLKKKW